MVEFGITLGSFGMFFTLFTLFVRAMPSIAIAEVKEGSQPPMKHEGGHKEFASERLED